MPPLLKLLWTVGSKKSVKDSFDFEFQSRLHECEATIARDKFIFLRGVGTHLCAGFFVARRPVTTEWPAGWDMLCPLYPGKSRGAACAWEYAEGTVVCAKLRKAIRTKAVGGIRREADVPFARWHRSRESVCHWRRIVCQQPISRCTDKYQWIKFMEQRSSYAVPKIWSGIRSTCGRGCRTSFSMLYQDVGQDVGKN